MELQALPSRVYIERRITMPQLTEAGLKNLAQDLTKIALEHNLISYKLNGDYVDSPEEKAKCVANYYKTLLKTLNPEK